MPRITPNLWFDTVSKQATEFFSYYGEAGSGEAGSWPILRRGAASEP